MSAAIDSIRPAVSNDCESIWPLARGFATTFRLREDAFAASFEANIHHDEALLIVAERDDGIVGYLLAHCHPTFLANGPVGWVEEVMVDESWRRKGVGEALMAAAETWSAAKGAAYIALASRRALSFYEAIGYEDSATFFRKSLT
ncbi:GNAT family N-acetyltransferase [Micromonospora sp. DT81.3]|uniref:GNAT family N-acetyltransferase n=1 Tax=Micromonospora sp. DT81.3 TaxID=3416523 RepID=UPI003CEF2102